MESSLASIRTLVTKLKNEMFLKTVNGHNSSAPPSAYDTAWLAMVPHPMESHKPLFMACLEWLLDNQSEEGHWGDFFDRDLFTVGSFSATLTSMVVLQKWGVGSKNIEKGLKFLHENIEMLHDHLHHLPRSFIVVFPAIVELAESSGLDLNFSDNMKLLVSQLSDQRQQILDMEEIVDEWQYPPLLAYLETFQSTKENNINHETITKHLNKDGSLFQSPSATAQAYISTGNHNCLDYLTSLVQKYPNGGVPQMYPIDQELVELSMVDQVQMFGLSEYFTEEIDNILRKVYRSYMKMQDNTKFNATKLYKDALAFRVFRMNGYNISPSTFCWFLYDDDRIMDHLESNCQQYTSLLYNLYKATDLMFFGEHELDEARSFSMKILQKILTMKNIVDDNVILLPNLSKVIEKELSIPWIARLDHLDHRMWIEQNKQEPLWKGKTSFYRLSCVHNTELKQLAVENYVFRQYVYQKELTEVKRWSKKWGLTEMGFGREKTMYCYFVVAASSSLPHDSMIRMLSAKSAILVTVADDFFDMQGSLEELHVLIKAIDRWDGKDLSGPSKVIFDVLDELVRDATKTLVLDGKFDLTEDFRDLWRETFNSWLTETTWGKTGYIPSTDEYLETGMISIATHVIVLTSACFLNPSLPRNKLKPQRYENITRSLMASARLLNDIQSYQKEQKEGKMNLVLLHSKENPDANMDDSIAQVKQFLERKRKDLLQHVFTDEKSDFPNQWKDLHLSAFKVFQMLFHSTNLYDTETALQLDIEKAIFLPPANEISKHLKPQTTLLPLPEKQSLVINAGYVQTPLQRHLPGGMNIKCLQLLKNPMKTISKVFNSPALSLSFI